MQGSRLLTAAQKEVTKERACSCTTENQHFPRELRSNYCDTDSGTGTRGFGRETLIKHEIPTSMRYKCQAHMPAGTSRVGARGF